MTNTPTFTTEPADVGFLLRCSVCEPPLDVVGIWCVPPWNYTVIPPAEEAHRLWHLILGERTPAGG